MAVQPVKYLLIPIEPKTFNRIIRFVTRQIGGTSDLYFMCDKKIADEYRAKLAEPNEFVRLRYQEYYIDLTIDRFTITDTLVKISFDKVIDYNHTRYIPKQK